MAPSLSADALEGVAIIGMAGRFPGARTLGQFWDNLRNGVESISFFTTDELTAIGFDPALASHASFVRAKGVLEDADLFDAHAFGYTPAEAQVLDPQHRVFLECGWHALEHAGYDADRYAGSVGVYAGLASNSYMLSHFFSNPEIKLSLGTDKDFLASRLSYKLNLRGPSMVVQTACSTSLVAVCQAAQSLLDYHCDIALAGGVAVSVPLKSGHFYVDGGIFSPDGHCRPFDARSQGTVNGNGIGVVVLKRLSDAMEDGDCIHAVIRGFAVNNDGAVKIGYTAPSIDGQAQVIAMAQSLAGVPADSIGYVEAHGTATALGDPIEVAALTQAFRATTTRRQFCAIGSVKANIGHLDTAAGVAGLIKTVLALEHREIPPTPHFTAPNPKIDFADSPFFVSASGSPWPAGDSPRRAGVSSFGIGGTNAHVVLEEAPERAQSGPGREWQVLTLSARTATAADTAAAQLADHLDAAPDRPLADVAYTLHVGRREFDHRRVVVCRTAAEGARALRDPQAEAAAAGISPDGRRDVAFVVRGAGPWDAAAWVAALGADPDTARFVTATVGRLPVPLAHAVASLVAEAAQSADPTAVIGASPLEPILRFIADYARARQWIAWGVRPVAIIGAGGADLLAAALAGLLDPGEALRRLSAGVEPTGAAVWPPPSPADGPVLPCISMDAGSEVTTDGVRVATALARTGVDDALALVSGTGASVLLGAGWNLGWPAGAAEAAPARGLALVHAGDAPLSWPAAARAAHAIGRLWLSGVPIDWTAYHAGERRLRVELPLYPFERQRHWVERPRVAASAPTPGRPQIARVSDPAKWFYLPSWKRTLRPSASDAAGRPSRWLVLGDRGPLAARVAAEFAQAGALVVMAIDGRDGDATDADEVAIDPLAAADYFSLARDPRFAGDAPVGIAHLWSATADDAAGEAHASRAFYSLLYLAKAFGDSAAPIRIVVATVGAHEVTGREALRPASAMVVGPCRVIPQEYPQVACRHVDLPDDAELLAAAGAAFARECLSDAHESSVAYRHADRFVQVFEPAPLEAAAGPRTARLREGGVYLVTGGLGNIGLTIGRYLADAARARLVLVGRTGLPPRDEWARRLSGERDAVTERIRQVQAMEAAGAQVLVLAADVADRDRLQDVVDEAERRLGPLNGVVHAAGAMSGRVFRPIRDLEVADCEAHFGPKVRGLAALDAVLGRRPLDFCLLASSLSPVLGGLGHAAYASANAVMDVLAWQRSREPASRWVSVNWDGWWFGGPDRQGASPLLLSAREGLDAFARVLSADGARQIVVSTGDLAARLDQWVRMSGLRQPALAGEVARPAREPRPALHTEFVAPAGDMERAIAETWEDTLGVDGVGADDNFFELGGDSYVGLQLVARLSARLGTKVPAVSLYEAPTVATLARLLRDGQRTTAAPVVDSGRVRGERRREAAGGQVRPEPRATSDVTRDGPGIRETAKMSAPRPSDGSGRSDVAIIGMSGRFPGARDLETFWQNLRNGVESRTIFSDEELAAQGLTQRSLGHPRFVKSGFTLDDYDQFDAAFFGINPREAELLDPQHRLFLETAWEALEDAGYDSDRYPGAIAVFGGSTFSGYLNSNVFRNGAVMKAVGARQAVHGSVPDYMVTRVSYKLNLRGPCYFVQTACSTSLVAVHLGCQSLASHESDMVLAGGVAVMVPHRTGYVYEEGGMMSPDGLCRAFDAKARGTVFGSGVGLIVLKRLSDALADGDRIHAVIKGAAANNDGSLKVGFTAPGVAGQAQVVAEALANAGVSPDSISYIEAHGTGTELGDPIEVAALTRAYRNETDRRHFCAIGSVKPNVGHLDAAAGVSSLIKTTLALQHRELPPTINFDTPNPKIDFEDSPFYVNTTLQEWTANGGPRRAGVSSFGFGGTNAHIILEEAPEPEAPGPARSAQLIVLSARTETALDAATERLARHLTRNRGLDLADVAYTTQMGRRPFMFRRAIVCGSTDEAIDALQGRELRRTSTGQAGAASRSVAFLFPGQGAQYVNMGADLYREERVFRETVDQCAALLQPLLGFDLREALYPAEGVTDETSRRLRETATTQAALFVTELALARLWVSWGIQPTACLGHSIGELVAACFSGVLSLEDALHLVALRGQLMERMPRGTMLAVPLEEARLAPMLGENLWLAAVNAPGLCVVSGTHDAIEALADRLRRDGIESRPLHTSHAFHSGLMDDAVAPFVDAARRMTFGMPRIPYLSNLTGTWITPAELQSPEYWGRHIRQAVRFSDGVAELLKDDQRVLLEVGPGNTLSGLIRQQARGASQRVVIASLRHAQEQVSDVVSMLGALGRLWTSGVPVDWAGLHAAHRRHRVSLPTYPFERQRFWIEAERFSTKSLKRSIASMERTDLADWFHVPSWTRAAVPPVPPVGDAAPEPALVFLDAPGVAARVAARLESRGHHVVSVEPGEGFRVIDDRRVEIDPASRADYIALIKHLREGDLMPGVIIHGWGLTHADDAMPEDATIRGYQDRGFYSLLHLAQAFGDIGHTAPVRLTVLTDGVHDVSGDEPLVPEKATALGPARVIPQEFPNIRTRVVDLRLDAPAVPDAEIEALAGEALASTPERDVAYRGGRRWTQGYAALPLKTAAAGVRLRAGGVYLITGGLGDIGLVLAQHLAEAYKARLVLVGRRGLPDRAQWAAHVAAHGEDDTTSKRIRAVEGLEAAGAEVLVGEADVTDAAAMRQVVDEAYARFGRIDGVVHSAGIAGGGMIQLKTRETAAAVLAPKVVGARVLARIFDGRPLDFFALCSSLTAVLGGVGQVDYCGANASLDVFARQYGSRTGTRTVSINWNAWREVGMAVDTSVPEDLKDALKTQMLASGISNADGVEAFRRILDVPGEAQVAVFPFDLHLTVESDQLANLPDDAPGTAPTAVRESSTSSPGVAQHQRPSLPTPYVAPRTDAERAICAVWQDLLGIDKVGVEDNFFDLGGHSLLAIRVMGRVNEVVKSDIPVARLYDGLTVAFLAGLVEAPGQADADDEEDDDDRTSRRRDRTQRMREQQRRRVATRR